MKPMPDPNKQNMKDLFNSIGYSTILEELETDSKINAFDRDSTIRDEFTLSTNDNSSNQRIKLI